MATYDEDLLDVARRLLVRRAGQRGRLSGARIRKSVSTTYYALFHFLLDEAGKHVAGTGNDLRIRRRMLARTISHNGVKVALAKVRGGLVDASVSEFLRTPTTAGAYSAPALVQNLAAAFADAHAKREHADYDLNKPLSEADARLLRVRVKRVVAAWRNANSTSDRDFKHALCMLFLLRGQLRHDQ